jgi:hypothetical protein
VQSGHWNNWKYGAGKVRFPHTKEFLRKLSAIGHASSKRSPALSEAEEVVKNIGLKGRQIISLPGAPHALIVVKALIVLRQKLTPSMLHTSDLLSGFYLFCA